MVVDQDQALWRAVARYRAAERGFDDGAGWLQPSVDRALAERDQTVCLAAMFEAIAAVAGWAAVEARLTGLDLAEEADRRALRRVVDDLGEAARKFDEMLALAERTS